MSFLYETHRSLIAWVILFIPFIILGMGIIIRNRNMLTSAPEPESPIQNKKISCAPYFM
jgi:hypothetical protein